MNDTRPINDDTDKEEIDEETTIDDRSIMGASTPAFTGSND